MADAISQLVSLLPHYDPTQLVLAALPELAHPVQLVALHYSELDSLVQAIFGSHLTAPLFSHLLHHRRDPAITADQSTHSPPTPATSCAIDQSADITAVQITAITAEYLAVIQQQLEQLVQWVGPEVAYMALSATPQLMDVPIDELKHRLQWLQHAFDVTAVDAMMWVEQHGQVLLLDVAQLDRSYQELKQKLPQWTKWSMKKTTAFLKCYPQALVWDSVQMANNWTIVRELAKTRKSWQRSTNAPTLSLVAAVLHSSAQHMHRLDYCASTADLPQLGLRRVLTMHDMEFIDRCPGFRRWRLMQAHGHEVNHKPTLSTMHQHIGSQAADAASAWQHALPGGSQGNVVVLNDVLIRLGDVTEYDRLV